jgi:predicted nucleic acid-binding protein
MKILVDTNIFLDLILKRNAFESAVLIFNAIEKRLFLGVVLDITILNIDYIAQKQIKDVKEFLKLVNKHFDVVGASNEWIEEALKIEITKVVYFLLESDINFKRKYVKIK